MVGRNRFPSLSDRDNLPYVNAVLLESLRAAALAFVALPHAAAIDVNIGCFLCVSIQYLRISKLLVKMSIGDFRHCVSILGHQVL